MFDDFWAQIFSEYGLLVLVLLGGNIAQFIQNKMITNKYIERTDGTAEILNKLEISISKNNTAINVMTDFLIAFLGKDKA